MIIYDNRANANKVSYELAPFTVDELVGEINDNNYLELDDNDYIIKVFDNAYFSKTMEAPLFRLMELDELQSTAQVLVMHIFEDSILLMIA
ncbi:MAG: hypothetical protein ACI4MB_01540 [Candidatus Coproplasma sp.]